MYCIIVKNRVEPENEQRYKSIMTENAQASVQNEDGCYQFDIIQDKESEGTFYLYEVYRDQEALKQHKETSHYLDSRKQLGDIVIEQTVIRADVIARPQEN
ncbi:antibiotic biosynthesis monooxygenase [Vibrio sp. ZSDE26]|uniref:Antibiotic biosynthesis monooxygenase n=1 Tax=Vibrio amylolyticus TaxID=2847292 RepID=A0A9X2BH79_9VIBR|nr:putative quinol monooxygenase [Vibrio amylolyticus]MCK6263691.1 antibiotic biosynthesis monooxygenase [Vibrio amylolyticus]